MTVETLVGLEFSSIRFQYLKVAIDFLADLTYPMVPRGDEEIRFQVCATHTEKDIETVLYSLAAFKG